MNLKEKKEQKLIKKALTYSPNMQDLINSVSELKINYTDELLEKQRAYRESVAEYLFSKKGEILMGSSSILFLSSLFSFNELHLLCGMIMFACGLFSAVSERRFDFPSGDKMAERKEQFYKSVVENLERNKI